MTDAYVGIGSNADPARGLRAAVDGLTRRFGGLRCSPVYRSHAHGAAAPDYLNMAVAFAAHVDCDAVKGALLEIEGAGGRVRTGERSRLVPIDLDLLLYGSRVDAARRLPHSDVCMRAYVLAPLAALTPTLVHPLTGEPLGRLWAALGARAGGTLEQVGAFESLPKD